MELEITVQKNLMFKPRKVTKNVKSSEYRGVS